MPKKCMSCTYDNPDTALFCQSCGNSLDATRTGQHTVIVPDAPTNPDYFIPGIPRDLDNQARPPGSWPAGVENGPQQLPPVDQREHVVLALDISSSMSEPYDNRMDKHTASQRAAVTLVVHKAQLDANDHVGLVSFNSQAQIVVRPCPLVTHKQQIIEGIQSLSSGGGTDIHKGVKSAGDAFAWQDPNVVRRIVLLTDGHGGHPLRTADELKGRGVIIDVTGIGPDPSAVDEKLLRKVASVVQGEVRYRFIKDSQTLVDEYRGISEKTATTP